MENKNGACQFAQSAFCFSICGRAALVDKFCRVRTQKPENAALEKKVCPSSRQKSVKS